MMTTQTPLDSLLTWTAFKDDLDERVHKIRAIVKSLIFTAQSDELPLDSDTLFYTLWAVEDYLDQIVDIEKSHTPIY